MRSVRPIQSALLFRIVDPASTAAPSLPPMSGVEAKLFANAAAVAADRRRDGGAASSSAAAGGIAAKSTCMGSPITGIADPLASMSIS